jgi:hypothetical protein
VFSAFLLLLYCCSSLTPASAVTIQEKKEADAREQANTPLLVFCKKFSNIFSKKEQNISAIKF